MIQKLRNNITPAYEILEHIITPNRSEVNTNVLVNGTTVVEMTCALRQRSYQAPRFFSSNDTNTDSPGWNQAGTWGLQFEDSGTNLSIKMLGADYSRLGDAVVVRTGIMYNDLANKKLRYNLTAAGILTIFNTDDTVFRTYDATAETDTSATSSTPIKLFHRYASHEYFNNQSYVYDVKIWDNNVLIRHYLPVRRLSDSVYGLYDIINNTFHQNEISGRVFSGNPKQYPEYIYDTTSSTVYVNDIIINGDHINRIYLNGDIYWGGEAPTTHPTYTYEVLEEVHPLSNNTFINTNITTSSNLSFEIKYKCPDDMFSLSNSPRIIGSSNFWNDYYTIALDYENWMDCELRVKYFGDNDWTHITTVLPDTNEHIVYVSNTEVLYDETSVSTHTKSSLSTDSTKLLILHNNDCQDSNEQGYYYIYYLKIWDSSTMVKDYIPVKRLSDNTFGLYDNVSNTFYSSEGSGQFTGTSKTTPEYI